MKHNPHTSKGAAMNSISPVLPGLARTRLWDAYTDQGAAQRTILRAKSLMGPASVHRSTLADCIRRSNLQRPDGRAWTDRDVNNALTSLQHAGLLDARLICHEAIVHEVAVDAMESAEAPLLVEALRPLTATAYYSPDSVAAGTVIKLRLAFYGNDTAGFASARDTLVRAMGSLKADTLLIIQFPEARLHLDWLATRQPSIREALLDAALTACLAGIVPKNLGPALESVRLPNADQRGPFINSLLRYDLLRADSEAIRQNLALMGEAETVERCQGDASLALLDGDIATALKHYRQALKLHRKQAGKRKIFLRAENGVLFLLALLGAGDASLHQEVQAGIEAALNEATPLEIAFQALQALLWLVQGMDGKAQPLIGSLSKKLPADPLCDACILLALHAADAAQLSQHTKLLEKDFAGARETMPLLALCFAELLEEAGGKFSASRDFLARTGAGIKLRFTKLVQVDPHWMRALAALDAQLHGGSTAKPETAPKTKRLAWFLNPSSLEVQVVEQVARRDGFSDGRPVALKRLHERDPRLDYLTEQDWLAAKGVRKTGDYLYREDCYEIDPLRTLPALVGHPAVFDMNKRASQLDLVAGAPELVVSEKAKMFHLALSHAAESATVFVERETPSRYRVIAFPQNLLPIQEVLGKGGLRVPQAGRDRILAMVQRGQPNLAIRTDIEGFGPPAQEGISTPVVQLLPRDGSVKVALVVRPFGAEGPAFVAGLGTRSVTATLAGVPARAMRDLKREVSERQLFIDACPSLRDRCAAADAHEAMIDDLETQLEVLLELQAYQEGGTGQVSIEWPDGQKVQVATLGAEKMKVRVAQDRDWFSVDGSFEVDDGQVLEMRTLLDRLDRAHGRFIRLDDGRFIALTRQLQAQLGQLAAVSEPHKAGRRVHALGAPALRDFLGGAGEVKQDAAWKKHVARIKAAESVSPVVPPALQAELRDYQVDGFAWMARLAAWGAGACLADDMGLGKTVQAIAVILSRAEEGPCLVVAPTSVCANWMAEIGRFAPTLTAHRLASVADRAGLVAAMDKRDVLVCSYGLLHTEQAALTEKQWGMVVLDEAQAIKNAATRRAQASLELQAGFRLALTGTPVENDLDELWSLFSFVNPGLLGSREGFAKRFAIPIERDRNKPAKDALRALVRPFLLRRTKAGVLSELPSRTEQTMLVEMSEAERVFYEALRQRALESLSAPGAPANGRKIRILAEITKLRRACCNPSLIDPKAGIPSSKLEALMELVDELLLNKHRALIFSQFTSHLALVREALDERKLRYEYLDGSTPAAQRERSVAAFQGGSADLFLISLKAGGTGLNLTAADYVVHLDPWWNPAVEDQASDRAHRMGQTRPVTIYRLIMQGSIEERIVELHRDKRDLAADLLDGAEISGRLSEEALLGLIKA